MGVRFSGWFSALAVAFFLHGSAWAAPATQPTLSLVHREPMNLYRVDQAIELQAELKNLTPGTHALTFSVSDYFGQIVWTGTQNVTVDSNKPAKVLINPGQLQPGYYELNLGSTPAPLDQVNVRRAFGVAPFVNRTAKEARDGNFRFGLKKWNYGKSPERPNVLWSTPECVDATCKLGLQWTREMFNQKTHGSIEEMSTKYPINVILKVERFPAELYDEARYGPMKDWEAKYGKGTWTLKSVPKEQPYKAWLKSEIEKIPASQNVFEIWNEAWDKMSPEDFATISQWILQVITEVRGDNAIVGPNLLGNTSPYQFDARVIKAGGMKGMKMVALHPYAGSEDREWMREYKAWLKKELGQEIDIYITEFGSHSTPKGPAMRSEREQAQRVVRQALALYVEDVKALAPHWMGQTEANPTYLEDWFGFFRLNREPKPVVMAYAAAARMVDGSRYVGDLWLGPKNDAMLFERNGVYTLALGTKGETMQVAIEPGVTSVSIVNMVGAERKQELKVSQLKLDIGPDWTYVVGVSPELEKQASKELRSDRWPVPAKPPRTQRAAKMLGKPFVADGKLDEWDNATQIGLLNPKVAGDDASGMGYLAWDADNLYLAIQMRDNEMFNNRARAKLYQGDSIELFVSTEPRSDKEGFGPNDHQFFITPTSMEGKPVAAEVTDREAGILTDLANAKFYAGKEAKGWIVEIAIPWKSFKGFEGKKGAKLALDVRVNDADTSHERFKIDPIDNPVMRPEDPTVWSILTLEE